MADELLYNEDYIKSQIGAYRPHFNPVTKTYDPVIKCWPLEDFNGQFNQEREVIPGMENEVYDIALACDWDDYFDFRIIADCGKGHVRVSFFPDEIIISDLFVRVDKRGERYGTALLDYADELIKKFGEGKQASISALTDWEKEWYIRRGYKIIDE